MTDLRTAAQQALEALESVEWYGAGSGWMVDADAIEKSITALRAALAQQADTTDPGHDVDVLREHVRHLERRIRELHAQQAEPLTIERLRDALVASRIIPPAAVEDPDGYDDGVTLFRIEALHRRIT